MTIKTNLWRPILTINALLLAPLAFSQVSCTQLECGAGTVERDGECVRADDARPTEPFCATGTHYDDVERGCVADLEPTVCGPNTEAIVLDNGVIECRGTGEAGCGITCPAPAAGKVSVCGWLKDAETDDLIGGMGEDGARCETMTPRPTTGPCSIEVQFYDALMFAGNPTGTPPLQADEIIVNTCGRFVAKNLPAPALGFLAIGLDDYEGAPDNYFLGGVAIPSSAGLREDDLDVYAVRQTSNMLWSDATPIADLGLRGAYMPIFTHKGTPVADVVVTENGSPQPTEDFYFSDADPFERTTIAPAQNSTGANGSAIVVDSALVNHSGQGSEGELEGCVWPSDLADAIPGVYFVQARHSEDALGATCE